MIHLAIFQQMIGIGAIVSYPVDLIKPILPNYYYAFPIFLHVFGFIFVLVGMDLMRSFGRVKIFQYGGMVIFVCLIIVGVGYIDGSMQN